MNIASGIETIKGYIDRLDKREKMIILISCTSIFVLIIIITFSMFISKTNKAEKRIKNYEKILSEISTVRDEYLTYRAKNESIENIIKGGDVSLLTFLEKTAKSLELNIESIRPQNKNQGDIYEEERVEIIIEKVPLKDLVELLFKIESHEGLLKITTLSIKPLWNNPAYLNTTFTVSNFRLKEEANE